MQKRVRFLRLCHSMMNEALPIYNIKKGEYIFVKDRAEKIKLAQNPDITNRWVIKSKYFFDKETKECIEAKTDEEVENYLHNEKLVSPPSIDAEHLEQSFFIYYRDYLKKQRPELVQEFDEFLKKTVRIIEPPCWVDINSVENTQHDIYYNFYDMDDVCDQYYRAVATATIICWCLENGVKYEEWNDEDPKTDMHWPKMDSWDIPSWFGKQQN